MEVKYYPYLDQLKGLAILLMVMGHALAWSYNDYSFLNNQLSTMTIEQSNASIIWKIIYSFHMPLLFFVSGFLFFKNNDTESYTTKIKKRFNRLLIPYITTGVFVLYLRGYFGYWFFITLFVLDLIVIGELIILSKLKNKLWVDIVSRVVTFVLLCIVVKITKDYLPKSLNHLASLPSYYVFFMFGYMVHKWELLEKLIKNSIVGLACFGIYILLMVLSNHYEIQGKLLLLIPICAIIYLYNLFNGFEMKWLGGIIGKNSMEIYVFHLFFVASFQEVGQYILQISSLPLSITIQLTYSIGISAIAIILSLAAARVLKSNKHLAFIFGFKQ